MCSFFVELLSLQIFNNFGMLLMSGKNISEIILKKVAELTVLVGIKKLKFFSVSNNVNIISSYTHQRF